MTYCADSQTKPMVSIAMSCGTLFLLYDEQEELMRTVSTKEEALAAVALRNGWTYKRVITKKPAVEFEEAPF